MPGTAAEASGHSGAAATPGHSRFWLPMPACGLLVIGSAAAVLWTDAARPVPVWKNTGWMSYTVIGTSRFTPFPPPRGFFMLDGTIFESLSYYQGWYWCVAMAIGCLAAVQWTRRRAPLSSHPAIARSLVALSASAIALSLALPLLALVVPALPQLWLHALWVSGVPALVAIGVGLGVAARVSRSRPLAALAAGYAVVAVCTAWLLSQPLSPVGPWLLPGGPTARWQWFLGDPRNALVLPALLLIGAGLVRIRHRS